MVGADLSVDSRIEFVVDVSLIRSPVVEVVSNGEDESGSNHETSADVGFLVDAVIEDENSEAVEGKLFRVSFRNRLENVSSVHAFVSLVLLFTRHFSIYSPPNKPPQVPDRPNLTSAN